MSKNILIFSDGTGQKAGISSEERQTNVFKIYRSVRCGPDSPIDPAQQVSFYDPGIGTLPEGLGYIEGLWRKIYNLISQATGYGITLNIIECYSQIIQLWRPGDRIYLVGFSRGAYTVRCVAAVLSMCGVPTRLSKDVPMKYDEKTARKLAKEAVKKVYQHVSSPKDEKYLPQRNILAKQYRDKYASGDFEKSNAAPYFIGVFDTVAALMNKTMMFGLAFFILVLIGGLSLISSKSIEISFWCAFGWIAALSVVGVVSALLLNNLKFSFKLPGYSFFQTLHCNPAQIQFYDNELNSNIQFARHAIAIDEHRASFDRVPWGSKSEKVPERAGHISWLKQVWFAGNHSDIGGSYSENESGLSNISLKWMADEMKTLPHPPVFNANVFNVHPDPLAIQHDELKSSIIFRLTSFFIKKFVRLIDPEAMLHPSVELRILSDGVIHFAEKRLYRPDNLKLHKKVKHFFG
ncbi:hypothetical protein CIK05_11805 [Bdellovibrio sp. qaytius]|nr:hypothetical protein CIK05_11805 [Bdellovibrio sp. qaytius]